MATRKKKSAKRGVNKTAEIMAACKANPKAGPTEIAETLKKKGVDVTAAYVSSVKTARKQKRKGKGRKKSRATKQTRTTGRNGHAGDTFSMNDLLEAKKLVDRLGGIEQARNAVQALAKLS